MKLLKPITATVLVAAYLAAPVVGFAAEGSKDKKADKVKPYTLKTCPVSDEKLSGDPDMKPFVFTHEGREIKLCCKDCKKDFDKNPKKYIKKIEEAEKAAKK